MQYHALHNNTAPTADYTDKDVVVPFILDSDVSETSLSTPFLNIFLNFNFFIFCWALPFKG